MRVRARARARGWVGGCAWGGGGGEGVQGNSCDVLRSWDRLGLQQWADHYVTVGVFY